MLAKWVPQNGGMERSSTSLVPTVNSLFDEAFSIFNQPVFSTWATAMTPSADIVETADELKVSVDLPGHDPKSLQVKLEGDTLTIQAERKQESEQKNGQYLRSERSHGQYARSFILPGSVDGARCQANYQHGVLTVTLPKREEAKPRTIDINVKS